MPVLREHREQKQVGHALYFILNPGILPAQQILSVSNPLRAALWSSLRGKQEKTFPCDRELHFL